MRTMSDEPPNPITPDECRKAFEDDCCKNEVYIGRHYKFPDQYQLYETQLRWMRFQSAWNIRDHLTPDSSVIGKMDKLKTDYPVDLSYNSAVDHCIALVRRHEADRATVRSSEICLDEASIIDIIAEQQANGWEYGTHPRDKAEIVWKSIKPYLRTTEPVSVSLEKCARAAAKADGEDRVWRLFIDEANAVLESAKQQGARFEYVD